MGRDECCGCEGEFETGETIIEENEKRYCEVCYNGKQEHN